MTSETAAAPALIEDRSARDRLLDAAGILMTEAETAEISLHAIARRAGVTAPLATYHFKTKEGLLLALARRDTERSIRQLGDLLDMKVPADELLRIHISGIIRNYSRRPYLNKLLHLLLRDEGPTAQIIKQEFVVPLVAAQRTIIERGIAEGRFRPIDPALAHFIIVGACQQLFTNKITVETVLGRKPDEATINLYARLVLDVFLNGVAQR
jgi:TetR/AcrR family transcriptional regulator